MMVKITIDTSNAAFDEDAGAEVARILRELADHYEVAMRQGLRALRDINGNTVGMASVA